MARCPAASNAIAKGTVPGSEFTTGAAERFPNGPTCGGSAPEPYRGLATCYIEFGGSKVARFDANFLSGSKPFGTFSEASEDTAASKVEFGATRRRRWFGIEP